MESNGERGAPTEADRKDQIGRLRHFLRRFRALLFLCGASNLVGAAWAGNRKLVGFGLVMLAVSASTWISRRLLDGGRVTAAAAVAAYGELGLALVAGMLFPFGSAAVIVAALVGVAIALPYLEGRQLRWFLVTSYVIVVAVLWRGFRRDVGLALPLWLEFSAVVVGGAAGAYLLLLLLWQFTDRLRLTLEGTRREHRVAAGLAADNARLYTEAQGAVRARDEFLSIASHELKTPLTPLQLTVQGTSRRLPEIVAGTLAAGWLEHRFYTIDRQIKRLGRLVDELLDLSRLMAGKFRLELEQVELCEMVRELAERFREPANGAPPVQFTLRIQEGVRGRWDRLRLEQVVTNLFSNAIKYGSGRPIDVVVSSNGRTASLAVADHGVGISAEDQRRIFDRFERASTTAHLAGLGLGLFIARQIVDALGGTIGVVSELGKGSTFTVELPLAGPPEERAQALANGW